MIFFFSALDLSLQTITMPTDGFYKVHASVIDSGLDRKLASFLSQPGIARPAAGHDAGNTVIYRFCARIFTITSA